MKKALCVGINEFKDRTINRLDGCVNDAVILSTSLRDVYGYQVRLLTDEYATMAEILDRLDWLVSGVSEKDTVVFARSSHGSWTVDRDFDEHDFRDEVLVTYDHKPKEIELTDDIIGVAFAGCQAKIVHVVDTCHSGTAFRIPQNSLVGRYLSPPPDILNRALQGTVERENGLKDNMISLAACRDNQYALDLPTTVGGNGLFTASLFRAMKKYKSVADVFNHTSERVVQTAKTLGETQEPQLTCDDKWLDEELF